VRGARVCDCLLHSLTDSLTCARWADRFKFSTYTTSTPHLHVWNDMNEPSVRCCCVFVRVHACIHSLSMCTHTRPHRISCAAGVLGTRDHAAALGATRGQRAYCVRACVHVTRDCACVVHSASIETCTISTACSCTRQHTPASCIGTRTTRARWRCGRLCSRGRSSPDRRCGVRCDVA
jgi:hypothetical protein